MTQRKNKLALIRRAIEIKGYITVSVGGRDEKCRSVTVVDREWVTDITTSDLCGYVRIKKTKDAVVRQAEYIIAHESEIRAKRETEAKRAMEWGMNS